MLLELLRRPRQRSSREILPEVRLELLHRFPEVHLSLGLPRPCTAFCSSIQGLQIQSFLTACLGFCSLQLRLLSPLKGLQACFPLPGNKLSPRKAGLLCIATTAPMDQFVLPNGLVVQGAGLITLAIEENDILQRRAVAPRFEVGIGIGRGHASLDSS